MKAFTLIEVMISLFILLAGMTGVIKLQATSAVVTKLSGDLTYAQNLAQTALQKQMSRPINKIINNSNCLLGNNATLSNSKDVTHNGVKYTIKCTISADSSPMLGGKKIGISTAHAGFVEVKVTWTDLLGTDNINKHAVYSYGIITSK